MARDGGAEADEPARFPPRVAGGPQRVAGRRPALPNGRAVVGGLLVAAAVVGSFAILGGADDGPSTSFVVAARDLGVGEVVDAADLEVVRAELPADLAGRAFRVVDPVVGQRTVAPLAAGELVQRSAIVVPEDEGEGHQLSFAVDVADALAGTLEVGERVDLLVTYGNGGESVTEVVAAGATVAALPLEDDDIGGQTVVLLGLPAGTDVLAVTNAVRQGALTLVRSIGPSLEAGDRFEPDASGATGTTQPGS